jgi:hypothetical protein
VGVSALKAILFILLLFVFGASARAQLGREDLPDASSSNGRSSQFPGSSNPADELRYKAAVRQEEENHKDTMERADEIDQLGGSIFKGFRANLSREQLKQLERMEKLARKIRGSAGGSDTEKGMSDPPAKLEASIARLAELSEQLNECVKKTSRMVVSATVIERSNELIQLIRHIRTFAQP